MGIKQIVQNGASQGAAPPDTASTILLAAVAGTTGVLTFFGVNSDRAWVMLDEDGSKDYLLWAGGLAIAAVAFALFNYLIPARHNFLKYCLLVSASLCYIAALYVAARASVEAANIEGRPSIGNLDIQSSETERVLIVEVAGTSVDHDERVGVRVRDVTSGEVLLQAFSHASAGRTTLKAKLPFVTGPRLIEAKVWRIEDKDGTVTPEPACAEATDSPSTGADCVVITLP